MFLELFLVFIATFLGTGALNIIFRFLGKRGYLKYGDSGENIGKIASFMYKTFPSYTKKAALGNYFGKNLLASIKEFQRRTGLEADGNIGPLTLKKLVKYGFKY